MEIRFLQRKQIDTLKWDSCVERATNGNAYGLSWYLDESSRSWGGLVEGDYQSVMPLIWNRKLFGVSQVYQPYFCQQLGIYSQSDITDRRLRDFLSAIPLHFKFLEVQLNEKTLVPEGTGYSVNKKFNCVLSLDQPYEKLILNYSKSLKRSLAKAVRNGLSLTDSLQPETLIDQYRDHQGPKIQALNAEVIEMARGIIRSALERDRGFLVGVNDINGSLVAGAFFLKSHGRIVNLIPSTTGEGRKLNAMHFLLDSVVQQCAGQSRLLDFEGSTVPSIARFFRSFGCEEIPFCQIRRDRLPSWIKLYRSSLLTLNSLRQAKGEAAQV